MKKEQRRVTKAVKQWCEDNGHTFVSYENGIRTHDDLRVLMFKHFDVLIKVSCTSGRGVEIGVKKTLGRLTAIERKIVQAVSEGRPYVDRRGAQPLPK